ncbi:hypothetical protein Tco_1156432 [Tanacetum coccineum]
MVEQGKTTSIVEPTNNVTNTSTDLSSSDDEVEARNQRTRTLQELYNSTSEVETSSKSMEHSYRHIFQENGFKQYPYEHALRIQVIDIIKEVKDYLKKYSSAGELICRWNTLKVGRESGVAIPG